MGKVNWRLTRDVTSWVAEIGCVECEVSNYASGWWFSCEGQGEGLASEDEAKAAAETKLREMHDALQEHFAPVLRWTQVSNSGHEARFLVDPSSPLAKWVLSVAYNYHYVSHDRRSVERDPHEGPHTVKDHKRAAEDALRVLGVVFRVEGE